MTQDISIVIPALNEAGKIAWDVRAAADFLTSQNLAGEIIVVDDGSTDGTAEAAKIPMPPSVHLAIISYRSNRGKGYAVRQGVAASHGRIVLFIDSGHCVPYPDVAQGVDLIRTGSDLAYASRFLPESRILRPQPFHRRISAVLFRELIRRWIHSPGFLTDTQCGLKIYDGETARHLYADCETDGFMFDIEIILRAIQAGYRISEFPIHWTSDPDSRLSIFQTIFPMIRELVRIKKELHH